MDDKKKKDLKIKDGDLVIGPTGDLELEEVKGVSMKPLTKRLCSSVVNGPNGEQITVSWMPGKRVRFDLNFGPCGITKIFPKGKIVHVELNYESERHQT